MVCIGLSQINEKTGSWVKVPFDEVTLKLCCIDDVKKRI